MTAIPGLETFPPAEGRGEHLTSPYGIPLGARVLEDGRCEFRVWAPHRERVELVINERRIAMTAAPAGYHEITIDDCPEGTRYLFALPNGNERPDPASRSQPDGVHAASEGIGADLDRKSER